MKPKTAKYHRALMAECLQRAEGREADGDQILKEWARQDRMEAQQHERIARELEAQEQEEDGGTEGICPLGHHDCDICS